MVLTIDSANCGGKLKVDNLGGFVDNRGIKKFNHEKGY